MTNMPAAIPTREIRVEENLHYVKWPNQEAYVLANKGFTNWEQNLNKEEDDGIQYIGEANISGAVTGYKPKVSYESRLYPSDPFNLWVYQQGKDQVIGATFDEVEVETWNETNTPGVYRAYHRTYEVQPENPGSGAAGEKIQMSGEFQQLSKEKGTFNIQTKTFTKGADATASA